MSASKRVDQIAGHLNYPKGMLAGQVAIITGSGQGIGAECARLFANEGAKVVVADVDASTYLNALVPSSRIDLLKSAYSPRSI
jgi:S-adenosylhomocysteine hydrolase